MTTWYLIMMLSGKTNVMGKYPTEQACVAAMEHGRPPELERQTFHDIAIWGCMNHLPKRDKQGNVTIEPPR